MQELTRSRIPPGGWQFFQPQTGWRPPTPISSTFDQTVHLIIKHRLANSPITVRHNLATDFNTVANELETFSRLRLKIPLAPNPKLPPRLPLSQVAGAAADIKRAAQGTAVILDWLTSGGQPVAQDLANKRAEICVACPKNVEGAWYTVKPAEIIKNTLEARKDLKLETPSDGVLKSCDVCKCLMRLKVWTPLQYIIGNTKPEIMAEFPKNCWIKNRDQS